MSGDRTLIEPITLVLNDDDPWVRATAIRALGRFGGAEALAAIRRGLHDAVGLVTIAAVETLTEANLPFDHVEIADYLGHDDDDVVLALLTLLGQSSDPAGLAPWGGRLLAHRHWRVRQCMAELLAQWGGDAGQALLQQRLLVEEEEVVRESLHHALAAFPAAEERN